MSPRASDDDPDTDDAPPRPDPAQVWAAYGVSVAAAFHIAVAALVLVNRSR
ncbi:hypothetical protein SAMN05216371_3026 [Streptomyces sp. TLI_053]|uniref:hypothetical protein n=1 Tax=Streptomyces sp. TLI_053 TaxID=1855352 RepID=UPI00087DB6C0|nr:hypothetical protein [Streptomyces sp. TLI_053]SDT59115.1 hypothetical protein SAMN05216371_3026 [Streptomyces sp. TLI_053]